MFILITGGSGSGKSAYAESRVCSFPEGNRFYLATMAAGDEESRKRIARHRSMRAGKGFTTVECPLNLKSLLLQDYGREASRETTVLLECLSNLAANEMFDPAGSKEQAEEVILEGIEALRGQCENLVVVTNEIFSDGIMYDPYTAAYQKLLGHLNSSLAAAADEVIEVVCGLPICLRRGGSRF